MTPPPAPDPAPASAPAEASLAWLDAFEPFGAVHAVVVLGAVALVVGSCVLGRRWRRRGQASREIRLRGAWVGFTMGWQAFATLWYLLNGDLSVSLPLHVCDLAAWIAPLALWLQKRPLRALLYFWAIALSTQAFFTPVLGEGVGRLQFWFFWVGHLQIVGSAIYDAAVLGFRPRLRDLVFAAGALLVYGLAMFGLNIALGTNYGYVGDSDPSRPTVIDHLGPWPGRVFALYGLSVLAMALTWVMWPLGARLARGSRSGGAP